MKSQEANSGLSLDHICEDVLDHHACNSFQSFLLVVVHSSREEIHCLMFELCRESSASW